MSQAHICFTAHASVFQDTISQREARRTEIEAQGYFQTNNTPTPVKNDLCSQACSNWHTLASNIYDKVKEAGSAGFRKKEEKSVLST